MRGRGGGLSEYYTHYYTRYSLTSTYQHDKNNASNLNALIVHASLDTFLIYSSTGTVIDASEVDFRYIPCIYKYTKWIFFVPLM